MWWRRRSERDFQAEIESHLAVEMDRLMGEGMTEGQARTTAVRTFGNVTKAKERFYEARRWLWADHLMRDLRYALRILRKSPGPTAVAICTIALGMGSTSAIFTVVHAVLLRPLPYPEPDRLLMCVQRHTQFGPEVVTLPDYLDWRDQSKRFESLGGAWHQNFNLTGVDEPERLAGASVTANLFRVFGTPPQIGRVIADDRQRNEVVLSHALWQRRFGGNSDVLGRGVILNGKPYNVIGVMPPGFGFPATAELWVPLAPEPGMNRGYHQLWVVGRLNRDATIDQARAELTAIAARAEQEHPATNKNWGVQVSTLQDHIARTSRKALLILAAAVGCLLLLACANVAALLMSRAVTRRHEMSVRAALGASRRQIVRQVLVESLVLSSCGGAAGLALAAWFIEPLLALTTLPRAAEVTVDISVLVFVFAASVGTGILFGIAPAFVASRAGLRSQLNERDGTKAGGLRLVLVGLQIAIAAVLLSGAGLLMRSFHRLQQVETGFDGSRVLTVRFFLPRVSYPAERSIELYQRMIERISMLPGVEAAAAVSSFPFSGVSANVVFDIPGRPPAPHGEPLTADFRAATPGYFRTIGIPMVNGRDFAVSDSPGSRFVAVVNRAMADRFFEGRSPIGQFIQILGPKPRMIVGIVQNIRHRGLDSLPEPEIYVPHTQFPTGGMFLAARTGFDNPSTLAGGVRAELRRLDPGLPIARIQSGAELLDRTLSPRRFSLVLLTVFAIAALTLSIVGTYGMLAFTVSQRTKEIGIRMAIGAATSEVVRSTLRQGMAPVAIGLAGGLAGAVGATQVLKSMLFEIKPTDPATLAAVAVLLAGAALTACLIPALRAAQVDSVIALRHDG